MSTVIGEGGSLSTAIRDPWYLRIAYALALRGYDVLLLDYFGDGYSEGFARKHDFVPAGEHRVATQGLKHFVPGVHPALDQLADRRTGIDGRRRARTSYSPHNAAPVTGTRALIAPDAPVILLGESTGTEYVKKHV